MAFLGLLVAGHAGAARSAEYPSQSQPPPNIAPHGHSGGSDATRRGTLPSASAPEDDRTDPAPAGEGPALAEGAAGKEVELPPGLLGAALHGRGAIAVEYLYTGEVFTNMRGGMSTRGATEYLGLIDVAITADLDALAPFPGGTFFILGENAHGRGLTCDYVGDAQVLSNLDPCRPLTQVTEYWWQGAFCDDRLAIRLGKQDANVEFAVVELGGDFIHTSFSQHYNIPMPSWPDPSMGAVAMVQLTDVLVFKLGAFDGMADGRTWGFSGTGDVFSIGEFEREWEINGLAGDIHIGMWHHSGQWANLDDPSQRDVKYSGLDTWHFSRQWAHLGGSGAEHDGNHGVYLGFDQMLWMESADLSAAQGLGMLLQYAWAMEDVNPVPHFFGAGLIYRGLIPARDEDVTGLGVAHAIFSDHLEDTSPETAIELFHKIQLTPYVTLQPDLQFIAHPGGTERDAFVAGLRFEATL